ncbi:MAG: acetylglutamate kinase [Bacteroidota bacterium]|nr:acetylglutamate kinase [Bacteroidota bacterium]
MKDLTIVKIGGQIIDNEKELNKFLISFSKIKTAKLLVHGGGKLATELCSKLGIETKMVEGRRITNAETLKIATMVYAGLINKLITAKLNSYKTYAIGLCGADAFMVPSEKRKKGKIDYGFVGDVIAKKINTDFLKLLLDKNISMIIAPITSTKSGQLLNTNADTIASTLASSLGKYYKVKFIYCFEKEGVLNGNKVIKTLNKTTYAKLKAKKVITDGMITKLDNAFAAIEKNVSQVTIGKANELNKLLKQHAGTTITK